MKLTFLGTGAGETYPGYWCECPHCTYARKHRGKNLRTNSSMVIDEELLIDMGPSCFDNAARFGVNLSKLKTLLVTHPHEDHLYPAASALEKYRRKLAAAYLCRKNETWRSTVYRYPAAEYLREFFRDGNTQKKSG